MSRWVPAFRDLSIESEGRIVVALLEQAPCVLIFEALNLGEIPDRGFTGRERALRVEQVPMNTGSHFVAVFGMRRQTVAVVNRDLGGEGRPEDQVK